MYGYEPMLVPLGNQTALSIDATGTTLDADASGIPRPRRIYLHNRGSEDIYWMLDALPASIITSGATASMRIPAGVARTIGVQRPGKVSFKCDTGKTSTLDLEIWG